MTTKNQKRNPKKRKTEKKQLRKNIGDEGLTVRYHDKQRHKDTTRVHL